MKTTAVIYSVCVPSEQHNLCDDTPDEYRVEIPANSPVRCIIYGRYGKRWLPNVSARWLVRHLIEQTQRSGVANEGGPPPEARQ